jgi:hypothetical protein
MLQEALKVEQVLAVLRLSYLIQLIEVVRADFTMVLEVLSAESSQGMSLGGI